MRTGVRASYRTAGTQPRHTACMFQPRRMTSANGAGRPHAAQQGPKVDPPEVPKNHGGGKTNPTGDSPKPPRGPQGTQSQPQQLSPSCGRYGPSLGQPKRAASGSRQTSSRDVLNRGETTVKEKPQKETPRDGARGTRDIRSDYTTFPGHFDMVWASPVCTEYSRALTTRPRRSWRATRWRSAPLRSLRTLTP